MEESVATLSVPSRSASRSSSRRRSVPRREETQDSLAAGRAWARTVEDAWWPCILTLDGGGIRGYSSLLILKSLMHEVWKWEQYYDSLDASENQQSQSSTADLQPSENQSSQSSTGGGEVEASHHVETKALIKDLHSGSAQSTSAEEAEASHGVETDLDIPERIPVSVANTTVADSTTAKLSKRKALSEEELMPCHYFDFMYGTSTGGLIATILGRLRMTVTEGLELYRKVGDDLFGQRRTRIPLMTKFYHEPLEKAVREIVKSRCHEHEDCDGNDLYPHDADHVRELIRELDVPFDVNAPRICQSCCLTATHDQNISEAYLLRSYPLYYNENTANWITRYNEGADMLPIWQVTRATTAAPFYFEMVTAEVDGEMKSFKDGGIRENNPSGAALSEFHALYGQEVENPALMLSVGTGRPDTTHDGFATAWSGPFGQWPMFSKLLEKRAIIQNLLIKYTEGEKQHKQMREYAHGEHTWYKRLNVSSGLENMPLDEWQKGIWTDSSGEEKEIPGGASLTRMEEATAAYLARGFDEKIDSYAPPKTLLTQAAQKLVIQRRAREAQGGERWETFIGNRLRRRSSTRENDD